MCYYGLIFVFILFYNCLSINSELTMEKIVGGFFGNSEFFAYQVGIIGKYNSSYTSYLTCTGGILSDFFILGSDECFIDPVNNELMKIRFFVIVGSVNLKDDYKDALDVVYIYTYTRSSVLNRYHLAILELANTLNLTFNTHLKTLRLPPANLHLSGLQGIASGYGTRFLSERTNRAGKGRPKMSGLIDHLLMYVPVHIQSDEICHFIYPLSDPSRELCGMINPEHELEVRGICAYDEGAPLVIGNDIVIGIANRNSHDCDDTVYGNIYTKVSYYIEFINGVIHRNNTPETFIRLNRRNIRPASVRNNKQKKRTM